MANKMQPTVSSCRSPFRDTIVEAVRGQPVVVLAGVGQCDRNSSLSGFEISCANCASVSQSLRFSPGIMMVCFLAAQLHTGK
jgi:hypothetical protein